jgi:hypothetical protein
MTNISNIVSTTSKTNDCVLEPEGSVAPKVAVSRKHHTQQNTGENAARTLAQNVRHHSLPFHAARGPESQRHSGIEVCARNIAQSVNQSQDNEPECDGDAHV